jgi:hypothetical protein
VADNDDLVQRTFTLQLDRFGPSAAVAAEKLKVQFPIKQAERRPHASGALLPAHLQLISPPV